MNINAIKIVLSIILSFLLYVLGGWDISLQVFFIFMFLDIATGIACACKYHNLSSERSYEGVLKKLGYIVAIMIAVGLDRLLGQAGIFRTTVIYYLVATDGISIIENLAILGVPLPEKIKDALHNLKDKQL